MIKIIGGKYKRSKIEVPPNEVRPTSSIKREAIYSILESYASINSFNLYSEKCFIDFFAGSGSLGLEAISRGASFSYFYELDNNVIKVLEKNCDTICKNKEYKIFRQDCVSIEKFDLLFPPSVIFIDPPYNYSFFDKILDIILKNNILTQNTIIVIETDKEKMIKLSSEFDIIKIKIYGKTKLSFLIKS